MVQSSKRRLKIARRMLTSLSRKPPDYYKPQTREQNIEATLCNHAIHRPQILNFDKKALLFSHQKNRLPISCLFLPTESARLGIYRFTICRNIDARILTLDFMGNAPAEKQT